MVDWCVSHNVQAVHMTTLPVWLLKFAVTYDALCLLSPFSSKPQFLQEAAQKHESNALAMLSSI